MCFFFSFASFVPSQAPCGCVRVRGKRLSTLRISLCFLCSVRSDGREKKTILDTAWKYIIIYDLAGSARQGRSEEEGREHCASHVADALYFISAMLFSFRSQFCHAKNT